LAGLASGPWSCAFVSATILRVGYLICAITSGAAAVAAFSGGALLIAPAEPTGPRTLGRAVIALWVVAAVAAALCVVCFALALVHLVPGGGAED
jgi:hypothetical protein